MVVLVVREGQETLGFKIVREGVTPQVYPRGADSAERASNGFGIRE
jgi:hypothetical protein